ncbi:MAG: SDR family NAD(P)-dependent oxidoreductase [Chloroflexota bacterium]
MNVNGKRIVLTGAASGIGRELLTLLATYNADIVAADVDAEALGESVRLPQDIRASINPFVCDLATRSGTDELFAHALATMNGIDIFIANAGFAYYEEASDPDWDHIAAIYRVNVFSPLYTVMKMNQINPENPYLTVMTASTMAHWGLPGYALYASTKSALDRFADAYRMEKPAHARLMLVYPIGTRTDFFEKSGAPQTFPLQSPDAVARAILRGIANDRRAVYPSTAWVIAASLNRVVPVFKPLVQHINLRLFRRWQRDSVTQP